MLTKILSKASLLPIAFLMICRPCHGQQQYKVTPVLENGSVTIPGSPDLFTFNFETGSALDEQYSSFTQRLNGDSNDGIWVLNVTTGKASHLVKLGDPAGPGGAPFTSFGDYSIVKGSSGAGYWVIFYGQTSAGNGLYSVSTTGGMAHIIADQTTPLPGVGGFGTYNSSYTASGVPEADDQHVVFTPSNPAESLIRPIDGSGSLGELAGANTPLEVPNSNCSEAVADFQEARVFGQNVVVFGGGNVFDWVDAGLYLTTTSGISPTGQTCSPNNYLTFAPVLDYQTELNLDYPTLRFGGNNGNSLLALDDKNIYFTDGTNTALFSVPLNNLSRINLLLGPATQLPGMPPPPYTISALAAEYEVIAFEAYTLSGGGTTAGIFSYAKKGFTRITGTGDTVFGGTIGYGVFLNANAVSNGNILFEASGFDGGILQAAPATCAANVTADFKITEGPMKLNPNTGLYNQTVEVTNTSASAVEGPVSLVISGLTAFNAVSLYNPSGSTSCTALGPIGSPFVQLDKGLNLAAGQTLKFTLSFNNPDNLTFSYSAGLFSGTER
jgi:hypothetical protein